MNRFYLYLINSILIISMLISPFSFTASADNILDNSNNSQEPASVEGSDELQYAKYFLSISDKGLASEDIKISLSDKISGEQENFVLESKPLVLDVEVSEDARYNISLEYKVLGEDGLDAEVSLKVDGNTFFPQMNSISLARFWKSDGKKRVDNYGNEFAAEQVAFDGFVTRPLYDSTGVIVNPYEFYFSKGSHQLTIGAVSGSVAIKAVYLSAFGAP